MLSSLALASWLQAWNERQGLAAFKELAGNNAAFISQMRLPRSPELAMRLAGLLDMGVGFHFDGKEVGQWPEGLAGPVAELCKEARPMAKRVGTTSIATAPLEGPGIHLVLVREAKGGGSWFSQVVLVPALGLAVVCGGMGWWLGSMIVKSERLATLGRIATSLAHEIKNPAAAIRLHADLLEKGIPCSERGSVGMIQEEVDNITSLVNQWMYVAKASPGKTGRHDLCALLPAEVRRLQSMMDHANVVSKVVAQGEVWVEVDAERISQVLRNLLANAIQAMPEGGTLSAVAGKVGGKAMMSIADEGKGFSDRAIQHFGEAFYSEKEGGMGIGLALVKEVIEAHGGSVHPENRTQGGAVVVCKLPLANEKEVRT